MMLCGKSKKDDLIVFELWDRYFYREISDVEGEDEKLQRKQRCLTDLIESGFLICETGDDVMKEIKFYRNMNC